MRPQSSYWFACLSALKTYLRLPRSGRQIFRSRTLLSFAMLAALACAGALAQVKDYSAIVVFGDSLSDTGNVAHLTSVYVPLGGVIIPGPAVDYTLGQFTDGYDTIPAAQKYFGNWIVQFAESLPSHPEVKNSLDGGTNYAYGFATTGNGTSTLAFGPTNIEPVQVENIGQQITDYLSTHPKIDRHTLFVVWGGAIDVLYATSPKDVIGAAFQQVRNIQRLIDAGATQFLVVNVPPLGLTPRLNGTPAAPTFTAGSALFNGSLDTGIAVLKDFYWFRGLKVYRLDAFRLLNSIVAAPAAYSLTNVTGQAQSLYLVDPAADPDTYLFWDDLHPTTRGHNIVADTATGLLTP